VTGHRGVDGLHRDLVTDEVNDDGSGCSLPDHLSDDRDIGVA
jgi:hypothetical protein